MKLLIYMLILFTTFGVTVARETLLRFGLDSNYLLIGALAFLFTTLLVRRNFILVSLVALIAVAINLPSGVITQFQVDQDILLAVLIAIVILPTCYRWVSER